jgi:hypothetical protein
MHSIKGEHLKLLLPYSQTPNSFTSDKTLPRGEQPLLSALR